MSADKSKKKVKGENQFKSAEVFVNLTPKGSLKDFSEPMADSYNPVAVEASWDSYWESHGLYWADAEEAAKRPADEKFVVMIPPPNVTGTLHLGHALTCSVEDAIIRWNRMKGKSVLWVPGTDHAGIATQVVVEKKLMRETKQTRHDLGREEFLKHVWQFAGSNGDRIKSQLRRIGASVDWTRERFTMDDVLNKAVRQAFCDLHGKGLIYRANRLVHWSCALNTAISSIEVEHLEVEKPTKVRVPGYDNPVEVGVIHSFSYKFKDSEDEIVVATTRLETMLGDVAVAVHPDDPRYKKYHGKRLQHPFIADREMILITDPELVDMSFGTGAVKITPAHDPNDFACGERHKLPQINIFDDNGLINANGGRFAGQKRFDVRVQLVEELTKLGQFHGVAPNAMSIGICQRSGDIVEPVLRPQWWVSCAGMAAKSVKAVREGDLKIMPEFHEATWYRWLENIQDWCISRQLWWGHRIPAWLVEVKGKPYPDGTDQNNWVVAFDEKAAMKVAEKRFKVKASAIVLHQDPDVLDTWFSSGLFPFSTLEWPDKKSDDLKAFYPGTLLETGHDILFFWVARMVMQGLELTGELPFTSVYLHAMVRDKTGRKMSKSLGNVVDPIDVMNGIGLEKLHHKLRTGNLDPREVERAIVNQKKEFPGGIAECGADALRFGLLAYTTQGRDINLDIQRVVAYRQFCNKLWQATRFALMKFPDDYQPLSAKKFKKLKFSFSDKWILNRLATAVEDVNRGFEEYDFSVVCTTTYNFYKYDFCDHYLELIKPIFPSNSSEGLSKEDLAKPDVQAALATLNFCLDSGLRLIHPTMPFVTEELWHRLPGRRLPGSYDKLSADEEQARRSAAEAAAAAAEGPASKKGPSPVCLQCGSEFADIKAREAHQKKTGHGSSIPSSAGIPPLETAAPAAEVKAPAATGKALTEEELNELRRSPRDFAVLADKKPAEIRKLKASTDSIMVAPYPSVKEYGKYKSEEVEHTMELIKEIAHTSRSSRSSFGIVNKRAKLDTYVLCSSNALKKRLSGLEREIATLASAGKVEILSSESKEGAPQGTVTSAVNKDLAIAYSIQGHVDLGKELVKVEKEQQLVSTRLANLEATVSNPSYADSDPGIKAKHAASIKECKLTLEKLEVSNRDLRGMMSEEQLADYLKLKRAALENDLAKVRKNIKKLTPKPGKELNKKNQGKMANELAAEKEILAAITAL